MIALIEVIGNVMRFTPGKQEQYTSLVTVFWMAVIVTIGIFEFKSDEQT